MSVTDKKPKLYHVVNKRKQLEQNLATVSKEMYQRNAELAETNQTLSLLRAVDSLVLGANDSLQALCNEMSDAIVDNSKYSWIAIFGSSKRGRHLDLLGTSEAGKPKTNSTPTTTPIYLDASDEWLKKNGKTHTIHLTYGSAGTVISYLHCSEAFISNLRDQKHVNLICFVKLMVRNTLVGIMAVGLPSQIEHLEPRDEALITRIGDAVGVALDNRLLFEENQIVLGELQRTNAKLRALDKTKDDFISMASHQLRTPLTSVKGYVSMVLEGDAGKISVPQKKYLNQAFSSSQRMTYLIADLLNVSRLKTGKFVIERSSINLPDVVEEEVGQLRETAEARHLELTYRKPDKFPVVNLDDTKTRQVIMNFIDNAIYYTPSGGHIEVKLTDKPDSIEYCVIDDGIGVPKAEQHHLFSKFYRAGNAQKARPDGTGLGLFMAKKVIIAQGGAVIFQTQEGKGSTFGFSFPKDKTLTDVSPVKKT